jgi:hypothetical protein
MGPMRPTSTFQGASRAFAGTARADARRYYLRTAKAFSVLSGNWIRLGPASPPDPGASGLVRELASGLVGRLTAVYGLLPDVSKDVNDRRSDRNRMQSYIRPVVKRYELLAIMGIRTPRANR